MKRFIISAVLLLLCLVICTVSYFAVINKAEEISKLLASASDALLESNLQKAEKSIDQCEKSWDKSHVTFLVYLDHQSFSELEYTIPVLSELLKFDKDIAAEKIQRCTAVLDDLIDHQKVTLGNIL